VAIPESYINDMGQRLRTYKRVSSARDEEALAAIRAETEDRYGRIPDPWKTCSLMLVCDKRRKLWCDIDRSNPRRDRHSSLLKKHESRRKAYGANPSPGRRDFYTAAFCVWS